MAIRTWFKVYVDAYYKISQQYEKPKYKLIAAAQEIEIRAYSKRQAYYLIYNEYGFNIMKGRFPEQILDPDKLKLVNCEEYFIPEWKLTKKGKQQ